METLFQKFSCGLRELYIFPNLAAGSPTLAEGWNKTGKVLQEDKEQRK